MTNNANNSNGTYGAPGANLTPPAAPNPTGHAIPSLMHKWHTLPRRYPRAMGSNAKLAGVCEGIGIRYQVDPNIVRIAFVITGLSGAGITAYLLAWLLMPRAGLSESPLQSLANNSGTVDPEERSLGILLIIILGLTFFVPGFGALFMLGSVAAVPLLNIGPLIVMWAFWWLLYLLHPRTQEELADAPLPQAGTATGTSAGAPVPAAQPAQTQALPTVPAADNPTDAATAAAVFLAAEETKELNDLALHDSDSTANTPNPTNNDSAANTEPPASSDNTAGTAGTAPGDNELLDVSYSPIVTPQTPPQYSGNGASTLLKVLGWFCFICSLGLAAIIAMIAFANHINGYEAAFAGLAITGVIVGGGMLTLLCYGKFWKALIAFALLMALGIASIGAMAFAPDSPIHEGSSFSMGSVGSRMYSPSNEDELADEYSLSIGDVVLDLSAVDYLSDDRFVNATVDTGELAVFLPRDVRVEYTCVGDRATQINCDRGVVNADAPGGTLHLNLSIGIGELFLNLPDASGVDAPSLRDRAPADDDAVHTNPETTQGTNTRPEVVEGESSISEDGATKTVTVVPSPTTTVTVTKTPGN